MKRKFSYRISSEPLDEDWMTAELHYGDLQFGDIGEWGEKITFYGGYYPEIFEFPVDELLDLILRAKNEVRFVEKEYEDEDEGED
jgi:hypothetical protein